VLLLVKQLSVTALLAQCVLLARTIQLVHPPKQPNGGVLAAPHVNAALQRLEGLDVARPAEPEGIDDTTDAAEVNAAIERLAATCVQQMPQV
jgi:hypothetical protein